ncbi:cell wall-binding repeat-containing protein [Clostridium lundense]|uniref:cell wall-binding repeat-containing protein n=1 Tax=Clostridium lundense TaxID=319475 RepID=UPI000A05A852|nr:cell wall-binding repeat-containing protein [Clostridium lundense]
MKKRNKKALVSSLVTTFILTSTLVPLTKAKAATSVERMFGADRFVTAQNVATQAFGKAENVVIVNGLGYADAVSAAPLAKILNAPILLVDNTKNPYVSLLETLWKLGTKKVYIVGGQGVVTKELEDNLAKSYAVERISGDPKDGRYGTNAAVAKKVLEKTNATKAILVSAEGYADALSVASIAATKGYPVLFGNKNEVPKVVKEAVQGLEVKAVGGEGVLPEKVLSQIGAERIAKGADRFATNLNVLDYFKNELKFENIFVAAGGNDSKHKFADALVASAVAAKYGSPLVLSGLGTTDISKQAANQYIKENMNSNNKVTIVGGGASVDAFIESELKNKAEEINSKKEEVNNENKDGSNNNNNKDEANSNDKDETNNNKEQGQANTSKFNSVESIKILSLHQIKINFAKEINKNLAENLGAYQLDGADLKGNSGTANVLEDKKSVLITFQKPLKERTNITFTVKGNFIEDKETGKDIEQAEKTLLVIDKKEPTVEKVEAIDNSRICITFSEGVDYKSLSKAKNFKLDGETLDSSRDIIKEIGPISSINNINGDNMDIVNGIIIEIKSSLNKGKHTLIFPADNDLRVVDTSNMPLDKNEYIFEVK